MIERRTLLRAALAAGAMPTIAPAAFAQTGGNVSTIVVSFPAGGISDIFARAIAPAMGKSLGRTFVVENAVGATGSIAADKVLAGAQGNFLLMGSPTEAVLAPATLKAVKYKAEDFRLLGLVSQEPLALYVRGDLPVSTLDELVAHARKQAKPMSYASAGIGSLYHVAGEDFRIASGLDLLHVPYRGGTPLLQDLMGGVVDMVLDATQHYAQPLTPERLFGWHAALFPTGYGGIHPIRVGAWRDDARGAMQVISGPISRERVHFEAPAARRLQREMDMFLVWVNAADNAKSKPGSPVIDPVLKAAVTHLWFVTIHPFDDGNGRIARAIADWALARSEGSPQRFYSMSAQIRAERSAYYDMLERTQKSSLDITDWLTWFLACLDRAISATETTLSAVFRKAAFWDKHAIGEGGTINLRQQKMLNKLFDGFEGKLTTTKWAMIAKCSQDTAQRDIQALIDQGILVKDAAGGRSTSYSLADF